MIYAKVCALIAVLGILSWAGITVAEWHRDSQTLPKVRTDFANYQSDVAARDLERDRKESIDREITTSYLATIGKQGAQLDDARKRLSGVRVHIGTCPKLPATGEGDPPSREPDAASKDGQSGVVDPIAVAERFSACDATGARLNALIDRELALQP